MLTFVNAARSGNVSTTSAPSEREQCVYVKEQRCLIDVSGELIADNFVLMIWRGKPSLTVKKETAES